MPRAFDQRQLIVDRNPLQQLEPNIGNLPTIDPEQLLRSMLDGFKLLTGIDSTGIPEFFAWITDEIANILNIENWQEIFQSIIDFFAGLADRAGFLTVLEDVIAFFTALVDRSGFLTVLEDVIAFFTSLTDLSTWTGVLEDVVAFFSGLTDFSAWTAVLSEAIAFLTGLGGTAMTALLSFVGWLWTGVSGGFAGFGATVDSILKPLLTWLSWLWTQFGSASETFLKPIFTWLSWLWTQFGAASETFLKPVFEFLKWLWDQFGATVETLLKPIFTFLKTANLQSLTGGVLNTLWGLLNDGAEGIGKTLADVLTGVGDFVGGLIPAITGTPGDISIGDITTWASGVLTKGLTWPDFKTYFGSIPDTILGVLPVANINLINPELMSQGGFDTTVTLAAGTGWAWDGTTTNSGSGGSAKVTGNGTARALYSNQSIAVAPGDKVYINCYVKSTGTVGANAITLSVVEFSGTTVAATQSAGAAIAARAGSATFVQIGATPSAGTVYTVPAGVTSIRVKVAVTAGAATGSFVWFDDISVKKTGLLSGSWMQGVLGTMVEDLQAAIDQLVQGIKGGLGSGTLVNGATQSIKAALQSIFTTLFGPLTSALPTNVTLTPILATAISGLNASKIIEGDFPSERIRTRSIVTDKIAIDAVTTNEIGPLAVTSAELGTDAVTTAKIATDAVTTNEIGPLAVTSAELGTDSVTTAKIATDAVTANEIANETITASLLDPSVVPGITSTVKTATVGTGAIMARINPAGAHTAAATGQQTFGSATNPFFNTLTRSTPDITYPTSSVTFSGTVYTFYTGEFVVTLPGWYLCEVGLRINVQSGSPGFGGPGTTGSFTPNYSVTPILYRKPSGGSNAVYRYGTEAMGLSTAVGLQRQRFANSSWIVYLAAGDTVQAGYDAGYIEGGAGAAPSGRLGFFGSDGTGNDSYFGIALLNRS